MNNFYDEFDTWADIINDPESDSDPIIPALPTGQMGTIKVQLFDTLSYDETSIIIVGQVLGHAEGTISTAQLEGFLEEARSRDTNGLVLLYPDGKAKFIFEADLSQSDANSS
jgi:hypothetical protein